MIESDRKFALSKVVTRKGTQELSEATGFFLQAGKERYFITNHHVVYKKDPKRRPTELELLLHLSSADLTRNIKATIPLYDGKERRWLEHPSLGSKADVVAIPVDESLTGSAYVRPLPITSELPAGIEFPLGQDAYVLGYPLGFSDTKHNLPLVRRASVASQYGINFKGEPCFLIDAILHPGSSGSPVFARAADTFKLSSGAIDVEGTSRSYFLGVFSDEWEVDGDALSLNTVWYPSVIREILKGRKA